MSELKNILMFEIGDHSGDGHNNRTTFLYLCSHSKNEVSEAYLKGSNILGVDFRDYCEEYEEAFVPLDFLIALKKNWVGSKVGRTEEKFANDIFDFNESDFTDRNVVNLFGYDCETSPSNPGSFTKFYDIKCDFSVYLALYIAVVEIGNPDIIFSKVESCQSKLEIGGYGLFYG